jgi:hypothetical protein
VQVRVWTDGDAMGRLWMRACLRASDIAWWCEASSRKAAVLGQKWESAEGTVIDIRFLGAGNAAKTANGVRYLVEVRRTVGAPFRVEVGPPALWGSYNDPRIGQTLRMECDPHHEKARFDKSDPAFRQKKADGAAAHYTAELHAEPPAEPFVPGSTPSRLKRLEELVSQGELTTAQAAEMAPDGRVSDASWELIREKPSD